MKHTLLKIQNLAHFKWPIPLATCFTGRLKYNKQLRQINRMIGLFLVILNGTNLIGQAGTGSGTSVSGTCSTFLSMYEVGGDLKKYTNDDHLFTICPDDSNKQKVKIAFAGRFDIAPGLSLIHI